jgi:hypothetical protein
MNTLELIYDHKRLFFYKSKKHITLRMPSDWDELTTKQLLAVIEISLHPTLPLAEKKTMLLQKISGVSLRLFSQFTTIQIISIYDVVEVFLAEPQLSRNPYPVLKLNKWKLCLKGSLVGPADNLSNISFDEFLEAEDGYFDYCEALKPKYTDSVAVAKALDHIIAALFRPKTKSKTTQGGDMREAFEAHKVTNRQPMVEHVPQLCKLAILYYYQGSRNMLMEMYPHVFDTSSPEPVEPTRDSWLKMLAKLPNEKFGRISEIGIHNLHTVMYFTNEYIAGMKKDNG